MCGIAFLFNADCGPEELGRRMSTAKGLMRHRGPDGDGHLMNSGAVMGHRRLAVIDLEGSPQPMQDSTGRYWISYNGELYNFHELRRRLEPRWPFRTHGDVEVVLAGMVLHGPDFLTLMEGMWAFALWDHQARDLLLVRDRMGQKPLYYQTDCRRLACASEPRPLAALTWRPWQEDLRSTADYLRYGHYLPGTTAYKGVREVLPGHFLRWRVGQSPRQYAYWRLSPGGMATGRDQVRQIFKEAVVEGVRRRLVADVEVGALLSGGIDSSLVVSIVRRELGRPIKTFCMGFREKTFDERAHARRMAAHCGSEHFEGLLDLASQQDLLDKLLVQAGQPFGDVSLLPTGLVSKLAAERVKVALSGDGGDELFSGYQRYLGRALLRWYTRLPIQLRKTAAKALNPWGEPGAHHSASLLKKTHLFMDAAQRMADETPYVAPLAYSKSGLRSLLPDLHRLGHPPPGLPRAAKADELGKMMVADALVYLPQDILTKVDRASMAFSLEVRSPFLDRRVIELAFAMPRHWHRRAFSGKRMLRDTFGNVLPGWVWRRPKHGFGVPVHAWFRSGLQHQLNELLNGTHHPLNLDFVSGMIRDHLAGRRDHGYRLWHLFVYLRWLAEKPWRLC